MLPDTSRQNSMLVSARFCFGTLNWRGDGRIYSHEGEIEFEVVDPFVGELEDFVETIENGTPPEVGGAEGLRNVEILEQAARLSGLPCYATG